MPVADYKTYSPILDRARAGRSPPPAVNVTSLTTANAVLKGLAESKSDGIIQVSTGGGALASGTSRTDMGGRAVRSPPRVALPPAHGAAHSRPPSFPPLVEGAGRRGAAGQPNLFNGHMF